jgi:phosphate transport system substrate-binding protein
MRIISLGRRARTALGAVLAGLALAAPVAAESVRISGTGSGVGGMLLLANAFMSDHADVKIDVLPAIGSSGGISALIAGKLELAVSNRPPNDKEIAEAAMTAVEYARTPFVIVVHRDLGVNALSAAELAALFAEGAAAYPNGKRARPVLRLNDSTDTNLLRAFSPEVDRAIEQVAKRRGMLNASTDSEAADMVEKVPGAFATSTMAQVQSEHRPLVAVTIDGMVPSVANLAAGTYPYFKSLYMVANANATPTTRQFMAYVASAAASRLLSANGHLPRRP